MTGGRLKRVAHYLKAKRRFASPMAMASAMSNITAADRFPPGAWQLGHAHRDAAARPFRRTEPERRPGHQLPRKATGRWRLDQRRILRAFAQGHRLHRRRATIWEREPHGKPWPHDGQLAAYLPQRFLAADGYPARQDSWKNSGQRQGALESLAMRRISGTASAFFSPAIPASRAAGWRCGCRIWAPR